MNWEAIGSIGEVVGAIGVLITLIYFSVQIRRNQEASLIASLSTSHLAAINVESKLEESAILLCKANRREELTDEENYRLERIAGIVEVDFIHNYLRIRARNGVTDRVTTNFAFNLNENPALREKWEDHTQRLMKASGADLGEDGIWVSEVKAALARMGA